MSALAQSEIDRISGLREPKKQIDALRGIWKGRQCFILACGPSLSEYSPSEMASHLHDQPVIALKQAYAYAPSVCDFLVLNAWNYQRYDFSERKPLVVEEGTAKDPPVFGEPDIKLELGNVSDLSQQLTRSKAFSNYTFDKTLTRPWGPGVLYEIGFYLAEHMGVQRIVTMGWDVGVKSSAVMPHFYDRPDPRKIRILSEAAKMPAIAQRNKFLHENGALYNKPRIIPEEVDACADVSGDWADWLNGRGIEVAVISRESAASANIPRVRLEDVAGT